MVVITKQLINVLIEILTSPVITYLFVLIFGLINFYFFNQIAHIKTDIRNKLYNGMKGKLNDALNQEVKFSLDIEMDRAMASYYYDKLDHIYKNYKEVKEMGVGIIRREIFKFNLLGSASNSLLKVSTKFSKEFIDDVEKINHSCYENYVSLFYEQLQKKVKDNDFLDFFQKSVLTGFRENISRINELYMRCGYVTKRDIELIKLLESNLNESNNISDLYEVFKKEGADSITKILDYMIVNSKSKSIKRESTLLSARYYDFETNKIKGIADNSEIERIKESLLSIIERFQNDN